MDHSQCVILEKTAGKITQLKFAHRSSMHIFHGMFIGGGGGRGLRGGLISDYLV